MNSELVRAFIDPAQILLSEEWDIQDKIRLLIFGQELTREYVTGAFDEIVRRYNYDDYGDMIVAFGKDLITHDKIATGIIDDLWADRNLMVRFEEFLSGIVSGIDQLQKRGEIDETQTAIISGKIQKIRDSWLDIALENNIDHPEVESTVLPIIRDEQTGKWRLARMPRSFKLWRKHVEACGGDASRGLKSMTGELSRTYDTEEEAAEQYKSIVRDVEKLGKDTPTQKYFFAKLWLPK